MNKNKQLLFIYFNYKNNYMSSKSPIKDYSRLLGIERTIRKEENYSRIRTFDAVDRMSEQIKIKLDLSLKHNAKLLDENAALSELASKLRYEVKELNEKVALLSNAETANLVKVQNERAALLEELQVKQFSHEQELKRLLDEISILHNEKNDLEVIKNRQLEEFRNEHEKNMAGIIQGIRSTHDNSKDIYETQLRKLREIIERQQKEIESTRAEHKLQTNRLQEAVSGLESEIKHMKKLHEIELKDLRTTFQDELHKEKRALEREGDVANSAQQLALKRMRNELYDKNQEINSLSKKMANNENMHSAEMEHLKREKQELLAEIATAQVTYANAMAREKAKLKQINEEEIKNILNLNEVHIGELKGEINHLKNLLDCKSAEIKRLFEQNNSLKKTINSELQLQNKINQQLRVRIKALERDNQESLEAFKTKIAQLIEADMVSVTQYYQSEIAMLQTNVNALEEINKGNKEKLYKALQDNDDIRKNFEIEISKQKARVQDLKIKLAALNLEHKEQVTSLATKMELTSQTLVRQTDQKHNSQAFFEEEKKKFHSLSNAKDKEISDLLDTMQRMKKMHESEIAVIRNEKKELRDQIQALEDKFLHAKQQFEEQMQARIQKVKSEKKPQDEKEKEMIKELYEKNEKVENENIKLQKQVEHLVRENRSLAGQLGLKKGYIETLQLESCAAIEDEKGKMRVLMGNNEVSLKDYFEDKVASKDRDIEHLQTLLTNKEQDIRDLIIKYNGLEKRLEAMLASQDKLRELDQRVKNLGLDNNLVKNMAQLFNRPQLRPGQ